MSSINKFSFIRWILGIALVATSGIALAGNVSDTFTTGNPLTAAQMTSIKDAINDNDTRVDGIQTGVPVCLTGMTRVGPTCVDTVRQAALTAWNTAVNTCRTAGKRLLTPSEYIAAKNQAGAALGMITNGEFEWVDSVSHDGSVGGTAGRLTVGFMGPSTTLSGDILYAVNTAFDDASFANIFFRCAR